MANKDYYATLGVNKSASDDEIKSAYRQLAKSWLFNVFAYAN